MPIAHRHDDVEINVVVTGGMSYLFGGRTVTVATGETAAFWATMPHQLMHAEPDTRSLWLTVPMGLVLSWALPPATRAALLSAEPVTGSVGGAAAIDEAVFRQWSADFDAGGERRDIALLEVQARLRRLVDGPSGGEQTGDRGSADGRAEPSPVRSATARAATMTAFIAAHHGEPIGSDDVAAAVHLHPHRAMAVFREVVGDTIGGYLARFRVAQAQRLLLSTTLPVTAVGHQVGFGSTSRFYRVFTDLVGESPGRYRRRSPAEAGRGRNEESADGPESPGRT